DPHPRDHWDDEEVARRYDERERYERPGRASRPYEEPYFAERGFGQTPRTGPGRRVPRDLSHQADYRTDRDMTPEDREAIGGPYTDYGHAFGGYGAGGGYTPTPEEGVGRERRSWDERSAPGSWFGRAPADSWRDERQRFFEGPHRGRGPKGYTRSGERIREDVSDRLTDDAHLDASDIEVSVTGTEVTLNGTVDSRTAKRRAEDCADDVIGVTHVQNNLRVRPRAGTVAAQTDPRLAAIAEDRDPVEAVREERNDRDERLGRLQR
ncbi:MAG TPA: BON domain-containing protein, partial [Caulobacteraceae bacterium]|nr:BON domain-containing protein [Caulobacteraceae bacterium]